MSGLLGIRAYARQRGVNHSAVQKAISSGRLKASLSENARGHVQINPVKADAEWEENTNSTLRRGNAESVAPATVHRSVPVSGSPSGGPSFVQSHAIREAYLAKTARLNYEILSDSVVRVADVRAQAFKVHRAARDAILRLPDRVAAELHAAADVHEVQQLLAGEINLVLKEMADAGKRI